jgi:hypothetical protein
MTTPPVQQVSSHETKKKKFKSLYLMTNSMFTNTAKVMECWHCNNITLKVIVTKFLTGR